MLTFLIETRDCGRKGGRKGEGGRAREREREREDGREKTLGMHKHD